MYTCIHIFILYVDACFSDVTKYNKLAWRNTTLITTLQHETQYNTKYNIRRSSKRLHTLARPRTHQHSHTHEHTHTHTCEGRRETRRRETRRRYSWCGWCRHVNACSEAGSARLDTMAHSCAAYRVHHAVCTFRFHEYSCVHMYLYLSLSLYIYVHSGCEGVCVCVIGLRGALACNSLSPSRRKYIPPSSYTYTYYMYK